MRHAAPDTTVVPNAAVRIVWIPEGARSTTPRSHEIVTDSVGVYRACVPRTAALSIEVAVDSLQFTAVSTMFGDAVLHVVDVELERPEPEPVGR